MDTTLQDPLVGRVLDGRYHVRSRLARGGMATVYLALDSRLDREIALKVMHPGLALDDQFVSRFIREARSAARLSHPNVVAVHDQGADDGHVFLAMEYVAGRTLRDLLGDRGNLTPREALDVLESVAAALGAAHHAGLVHRDVKPENVLLADDGRIKVADFGLARAVSAASNLTSATGVVMGTVAYLAPEQVEHGIADPRSDVYAVGILLFEMLTGVKPFRGESAIQIAYRHVHEDVPAPSSVVKTLPPQVDALVARATCRDPEGRPDDARRLLTEITSARRSLSEAQLDAASPVPGDRLVEHFEHTVVVPLALPGQQRNAPRPPPRQPEPLPVPRRDRRSRRGMVAFLMVLLLAAALSAGAWWVAAGPGAYTAAPRLIELPEEEAAATAAAAGFTMRVTGRAFDETMPVGHVLSTKPRPTESIRKNGTIRVVLSKGPERYPVPDLRGRTRAEASATLAETHLTLGEVREAFHDTVARGRVISTMPISGVRLKRDQAVAVVLSKGVQPIAVPDVVGEPVEEAKKILAEAPLKAIVTDKYDERVRAGDVISQRPASGKAPKNSEVALVISKGPPPIPVPDVVGQSLAEARRILINAGFGQPRVYNLPGGPDRVLDQSPNRGQSAPKGSSITLSVF